MTPCGVIYFNIKLLVFYSKKERYSHLIMVENHWNPLTKSVQHKAVASRSVSVSNNLDVKAIKHVLDLLTKELTRQVR